jgi:prepilin-type N-terminal cleavage/methylation domain-containing protein
MTQMLKLICMSVRKTRTTVAAFTLIEILIGLAIIGLGASLVMPRLTRRPHETEWTTIQHELNTMLFFARQEAIVTQKIHRITCNEKTRTLVVEMPTGEEKNGVALYEQVYSTYFTTKYELPAQVRFGAVKLGKKNLFEESKGIGCCYVVPNGLIQEVSIELIRDDGSQTTRKVYQAAPFLGTFDDSEESV